jgi:mannose-1-phosphate guanylyltransferase
MHHSWSSRSRDGGGGGGDALRAVVLVGGEGLRLRPLTAKTPKPMLPLLGRPLLAYTFDHLRAGGVAEATLACGYLPTQIVDYFNGSFDGMRLNYQIEPQPLGTGGGIRYAASGVRSTFLALNGDSLREADIASLVDFHRSVGAKATILLARVADPARYGLVRTHEDGRVKAFVEKPPQDEIDTELINAGLYVLEPEVLDLIPDDRPVSIEREVFPKLVAEGSLYALHLDGYWLDVGTPASYLQAHIDLLHRKGGVEVSPDADVADDTLLIPPVVVAPEATIDERTCIGPFVHVGRGAHLARRVVARWVAVLPDAEIRAETRIARAIVAPEIGAVTP